MLRKTVAWRAANILATSSGTLAGGHPPGSLPALVFVEPLSKGGNARRFFGNYAGIVLVRRASRLTLEDHRGTGPDRYPSAAAAAFPIAHDVAPLGAVDIAMTIGER